MFFDLHMYDLLHQGFGILRLVSCSLQICKLICHCCSNFCNNTPNFVLCRSNQFIFLNFIRKTLAHVSELVIWFKETWDYLAEYAYFTSVLLLWMIYKRIHYLSFIKEVIQESNYPSFIKELICVWSFWLYPNFTNSLKDL